MNHLPPLISHAEPVFPVKDVAATVQYWHEVLCFPHKWTWGDPPRHGGVSWQGASIQFSGADDELAEKSKGTWTWIKVKNIESLYAFHQQKKAEIVRPLEKQPWGLAEYLVIDTDGHYIAFAGALTEDRPASTDKTEGIRIIERTPSPEEYMSLIKAVGWKAEGERERLEKLLSAPVFAVVAEDIAANEVIGCALLLGDNVSLYYVKDVMVHPGWQHRGIGSMMMRKLTAWLDEHAPKGAVATLITGENLGGFYKQFDFLPAFGMMRS